MLIASVEDHRRRGTRYRRSLTFNYPNIYIRPTFVPKWLILTHYRTRNFENKYVNCGRFYIKFMRPKLPFCVSIVQRRQCPEKTIKSIITVMSFNSMTYSPRSVGCKDCSHVKCTEFVGTSYFYLFPILGVYDFHLYF